MKLQLHEDDLSVSGESKDYYCCSPRKTVEWDLRLKLTQS